MAWIQNVSYRDIVKGIHHTPMGKSMLIQIVDPGSEFPVPAYSFTEVHGFRFLDAEAGDDVPEGLKITPEQAEELARLLEVALDNDMDVVVHCHAGLCRSGAVAEVGTMIGFNDMRAIRYPNILVKHRILEALGVVYDRDESSTWMWLQDPDTEI